VITVKGNCIDIEFDIVPGTRGGGLEFVITAPSEFVRAYQNETTGETEIRIKGNEETIDFLSACGNLVAMMALDSESDSGDT